MRPSPPIGATAYILNAGANTVSVINTSTNAVTATVTVGNNPVHAANTPDGSSVYVINTGSNSASVIDTGSNAVRATVPVGTNPVHATFF
jgi:YVTN family beta-propeller protein